MGKKKKNWQNTDYVLKLFNSKLSLARRRYREYVKKGISEGERPDLIGGGLVRSAGGWDALIGDSKQSATRGERIAKENKLKLLQNK